MTNKKTTKRALVSSIMAIVLCFSMLLGTTFAWFTDTAESNGNKIVAGSLDVELLMWNGTEYVDISESAFPIFGEGSIAQNNNAETLWEPGKTQVAYLAIKNAGKLDLKYQVALNVVNGANDLYEVMEYVITPDATNGAVTAWNVDDAKAVVVGTQTVSNENVALRVGETHYFALSIHMDEDAGNNYQNGEVSFDLRVLATQLASEEDSFDNTYDKNAKYPEIITVNSEAALLAAIANANAGDTIKLTSDITATSKSTITIDKDIVLDLNGYELTTNGTYSGIAAKGGCSIKNGTINHVSTVAAIKAYQVESIENVTINVTPIEGKTIGGIVVQEGSDKYVGSIKNVTITGATNGIETYRCGNRTDYAIGSIENVTIDATETGILLSAPIGTVSDSNIKGANVGVNMYLYGPYSVSMTVLNSTVEGENADIYAHDEISLSNPGSLTLIYDSNDIEVVEEFEDEAKDRVSIVYGASNATSIRDALANGDDVVMIDDVISNAVNGGYSYAGVVQNGGVFDGDGNTLTVNGANNTWDCAVYTTGGTIKDLTINGAFRGIFTAGCNEDIIIDNVVIDKVCYTISSDASNPNYSIIVTNSTLNGWTSYTSGYKSVSFTDCSFGKGTGGYQYAFCRPYTATTMTNCNFAEGYELDASFAAVTLVNCYVGDTLITSDNVVDLLGENAAAAVIG